jgi:hypothetical protein
MKEMALRGVRRIFTNCSLGFSLSLLIGSRAPANPYHQLKKNLNRHSALAENTEIAFAFIVAIYLL